MTNLEMKQQIEQSAQAELDAGCYIEINSSLPYVSITLSDGSEYFFQGEEASELIDKHELSASEFNTTVEASILHGAQGW